MKPLRTYKMCRTATVLEYTIVTAHSLEKARLAAFPHKRVRAKETKWKLMDPPTPTLTEAPKENA